MPIRRNTGNSQPVLRAAFPLRQSKSRCPPFVRPLRAPSLPLPIRRHSSCLRQKAGYPTEAVLWPEVRSSRTWSPEHHPTKACAPSVRVKPEYHPSAAGLCVAHPLRPSHHDGPAWTGRLGQVHGCARRLVLPGSGLPLAHRIWASEMDRQFPNHQGLHVFHHKMEPIPSPCTDTAPHFLWLRR